MHKVIASHTLSSRDLPPEFYNVFQLGVKVVEKEFETAIHYHVATNTDARAAELHLTNIALQPWFGDPTVSEIIQYKLSTHFKICMEQFAATTPAN